MADEQVAAWPRPHFKASDQPTKIFFVCSARRLVERPVRPLQSVWGLARRLCARGASVVLDVHAFRVRTRADLDALAFDQSDVQRDLKLVLETEPTQGDLHLLHTPGLRKCSRPELMCFIRPDDAGLMGRVLNQIARTLMEGASATQIRLR